jgi:hypothetical protein
MGKNRSRRRRPDRSRTTRPENNRPEAGEKGTPRPTKIGDLTDDLLELVLLSIRSPSFLVRAAATCKPWRRVIANAAFIRCFRCLHGPHVLGHYHYMGEGDKTVFVPSLTPTRGRRAPSSTSSLSACSPAAITWSSPTAAVVSSPSSGLILPSVCAVLGPGDTGGSVVFRLHVQEMMSVLLARTS